LVLFSPGSAETDIGCDGKLNGHLMASCNRNIFCQKLLKFRNYLRQGGNVFAGFCLSVCLSVCLCVSKITQKVMDRSF